MKTSTLKKQNNHEYDMIVFCHLRWDFVYQRPQHLISRMSEEYRVLVVEEPVGAGENGKGNFEVTEINPQLHILRPQINHLDELGPYLKKHLKTRSYFMGWFYSAAFVTVLDSLDFETVVYDCMDELSLFKGASPTLIAQEERLLSAADVVYTGGKSLYESKKQKHHNVFCFPSSVDVKHFASPKTTARPADIADLPGKIVGYYGVIDERIDLDLLAETAKLAPDTSFVMIGPICKIEEADLPRAKNIHYLGMKSYEELPVYLQHFDIAMMPFALNDATKYISPTKTLEYMAAGKPIISTKIKDVVRDYSSFISLVDNAEAFAAAVQAPQQNFEKQYEDILEKTSWDTTAEKMRLIIKKMIA